MHAHVLATLWVWDGCVCVFVCVCVRACLCRVIPVPPSFLLARARHGCLNNAPHRTHAHQHISRHTPAHCGRPIYIDDPKKTGGTKHVFQDAGFFFAPCSQHCLRVLCARDAGGVKYVLNNCNAHIYTHTLSGVAALPQICVREYKSVCFFGVAVFKTRGRICLG